MQRGAEAEGATSVRIAAIPMVDDHADDMEPIHDAVSSRDSPEVDAVQRLIVAGAALGLVAALVSWLGGDEFCDVASGDGLSADGVHAGKQYADERRAYEDRLDDASASAPDAISDDVETIENTMDGARDPSAVSSRKVDDAYANVDAWVAANC